jgi:hypothetical protein
LEKQYPYMLSQIKSYISEMGVTDSFYQQMVNTEPSQMIIYGSNDSESVVPQNDPTYDEVSTSYDARRYGITTSEMRQRKKDAEKECSKFIQDIYRRLTCTEAIEWGLSERVYRERQPKSDQNCGISDDEITILNAVPRRGRMDHPIIIRLETCRRNIMLGTN